MRRPKGLYKRGNIWWIGIRESSGKAYFESTHETDIRRAEALLLERKGEMREGKNPTKSTRSYTFQELAREYATWASRQRFFKTKKYFIRQLVERFGNLPLNSFTSLLVEKYQTEALKEVKPATANRRISCLKHMFKKAVDWKWVGKEVLADVRSVKLLEEPPGRLRYLSQGECQTLVETCTPHLKPTVIVALNTGMRLGEILGLRWERVDLRHGFILLDKTKNGERREIPINATLRAVFESIPHGPESEYVFTDRNGRPYQSVNNSFPTACKRAGITDFRFHDLRHTFASHLVMAGVDIVTVKELLGHKTLTMTLRYAHLSPGHRANAVKVLEGKLGGWEVDKKILVDN